MVAGSILTEALYIQSQIIALHTRYSAYCDEPLQADLKQAQEALAGIVETARKHVDATASLPASCPQCKSNEARLEKNEQRSMRYYSLYCFRCGYEDMDVSDR